MKEIVVEGGRALRGTIVPQGSKNAALPIIFASLLTRGVSYLEGVPDIGDVGVAVSLIEEQGAVCRRSGDVLVIDTRALVPARPSAGLCSKIRASSYLLGALLGRFGRAHISAFGGCNFGKRPIDMHIFAAERLGAVLSENELRASALRPGVIEFNKISVGATVNALLMAASVPGESEIRGAASEPHIIALIEYLRASGAQIHVCGSCITVRGGDLHGARVRIIPDMIEAGTYLLLAPLTNGDISVKYERFDELSSLTSLLRDAGVTVIENGGYIRVFGAPAAPIFVRTAPYPDFPTDLQPQMAPLMAKYHGGEIEETVWQGRFGYLSSLAAFGLASSSSGSRAVVYPSRLHNGIAEASDLRGGAAALMCALSAGGVSRIKCPEIIMRGYEKIEKKLASVGACVIIK